MTTETEPGSADAHANPANPARDAFRSAVSALVDRDRSARAPGTGHGAVTGRAGENGQLFLTTIQWHDEPGSVAACIELAGVLASSIVGFIATGDPVQLP
jgi:hypothetical protein